MLQGEHSAILSTFIKLPFVIKIFVLSIFERPFFTGFTVTWKINLILFALCFNVSVNSYGHTETVILPNHTCPGQA